MLGRVGSLRRAAAMSLRALSSAEASCSGRATQTSCSSALKWYTDTTPLVPGLGAGWTPTAPIGSRLLSSLEEALPEPRQATYYVEVITGDVRGAGSAAPAAITLFGDGK